MVTTAAIQTHNFTNNKKRNSFYEILRNLFLHWAGAFVEEWYRKGCKEGMDMKNEVWMVSRYLGEKNMSKTRNFNNNKNNKILSISGIK